DISDLINSLKFFTGISKEKDAPRYGVFNFGEKFEFWALVWGSFVMLASGLILMLPKALPADWPSWVVAVSRVVHFYEALLATLAILVWHVFHVMFHPDEYPLNTSWITGYITEKEAKHRFEDEAAKKMQIDIEEEGEQQGEGANGQDKAAKKMQIDLEDEGAQQGEGANGQDN
ncbi:MAG: hypothetical protein GY765_02700, partial [bacterium]|nr:hypothetical protein [bacterium]